MIKVRVKGNDAIEAGYLGCGPAFFALSRTIGAKPENVSVVGNMVNVYCNEGGVKSSYKMTDKCLQAMNFIDSKIQSGEYQDIAANENLGSFSLKKK